MPAAYILENVPNLCNDCELSEYSDGGDWPGGKRYCDLNEDDDGVEVEGWSTKVTRRKCCPLQSIASNRIWHKITKDTSSLPLQNQSVLVYLPTHHRIVQAHLTSCCWRAEVTTLLAAPSIEKSISDISGKYEVNPNHDILDAPTYWMELPEPPLGTHIWTDQEYNSAVALCQLYASSYNLEELFLHKISDIVVVLELKNHNEVAKFLNVKFTSMRDDESVPLVEVVESRK